MHTPVSMHTPVCSPSIIPGNEHQGALTVPITSTAKELIVFEVVTLDPNYRTPQPKVLGKFGLHPPTKLFTVRATP